MKLKLRLKGGAGSGHRGHAGRPGKRGGSLAGTGGPTRVAIRGGRLTPGDTYEIAKLAGLKVSRGKMETMSWYGKTVEVGVTAAVGSGAVGNWQAAELLGDSIKVLRSRLMESPTAAKSAAAGELRASARLRLGEEFEFE